MKKVRNIDGLIGKIRRTLASHKIEDGVYTRWLWDYETKEKIFEPNPYGSADAANIRYTIGDMPTSDKERNAFVRTLGGFQNKEDGLFYEKTHHVFHCTAHTIGALELFDALPPYTVLGVLPYAEPKKIEALLESLDWKELKGTGHIAAGIFSSLVNTKTASAAFYDAFFGYFDRNVDRAYGIGVKGAVESAVRPLWHHMGDWFHILFCYYALRRKFPCPERLIDSCIALIRENGLPENFGKMCGFLEIDLVFTLNRASMQSGYRREDAVEVIREIADSYISYLEDLDEKTHDFWNDLHLLFGAVCALSEIQIALPGEIISTHPLRQVLDRRPFI